MATKRKKPRIYMEKAKSQHTTHWDLDYLSREEVDALYSHNSMVQPNKLQKTWQTSRYVKRLLIIGGVIAMILAFIALFSSLITS